MQWPEGFRLDPEGRWDDEIERLSDAADAFDRVANVVQSTLSELCFPLDSPSRLQSPIIDPPPGQTTWPSFSLLSLEQSPGIFTTWYFGLPTSSSQKILIGGLVGTLSRCVGRRFRQHCSLDGWRGRQGDRARDLVAIRWIRRWQC